MRLFRELASLSRRAPLPFSSRAGTLPPPCSHAVPLCEPSRTLRGRCSPSGRYPRAEWSTSTAAEQMVCLLRLAGKSRSCVHAGGTCKRRCADTTHSLAQHPTTRSLPRVRRGGRGRRGSFERLEGVDAVVFLKRWERSESRVIPKGPARGEEIGLQSSESADGSLFRATARWSVTLLQKECPRVDRFDRLRAGEFVPRDPAKCTQECDAACSPVSSAEEVTALPESRRARPFCDHWRTLWDTSTTLRGRHVTCAVFRRRASLRTRLDVLRDKSGRNDELSAGVLFRLRRVDGVEDVAFASHTHGLDGVFAKGVEKVRIQQVIHLHRSSRRVHLRSDSPGCRTP